MSSSPLRNVGTIVDCDRPKLSLSAQFDDHIRMVYSLSVEYEITMENFHNMLMNYEYNRKQWSEKLRNDRLLIDELKQENESLKKKLLYIRKEYCKVNKMKDYFEKEYTDMFAKVSTIQRLLCDCPANDNGEHHDSTKQHHSDLLSIVHSIASRPLPAGVTLTVPKEVDKANDSGNSDDLLFDKSDDTIDDLDKDQPTIREKTEPKVPLCEQVASPKSSSPAGCQVRFKSEILTQKSQPSVILEGTEPTEESFLNTGFISTLKSPEVDDVQNQTLRKSEMLARNNSSKLLLTRFQRLRSNSKLELERLDSRNHSFTSKKMLKPRVICSPCGKPIGFCSTYFVCIDCRGVTHQHCRDKLPRPCIPYEGHNDALRKLLSSTPSVVNHIVQIGDFTPKNARPCIPALIIHCCNELDKRIDLAMDAYKTNPNAPEVAQVDGLYKCITKNGDARAVRELRVKMLDLKSGMPQLSAIKNAHVIANVLKCFLTDLDDPLVTRVLWQDFIRAAEHVVKAADTLSQQGNHLNDSDYESRSEEGGDAVDNKDDPLLAQYNEAIYILKSVIIQLTNANRDTLAFLFLHFRHVIDCRAVTHMNASDLAAVFAPTIVGTSDQRFYNTRVMSGGGGGGGKNGDKMTNVARIVMEKQLMVMSALFRLTSYFWNHLLKDDDFCPLPDPFVNNKPKRTSLNNSIIQKVSTTNVQNLLVNEQEANGDGDGDGGGGNITKPQPKRKSIEGLLGDGIGLNMLY